MEYVIRDTRTGKYVTNPGSEKSFSLRLQDARVFPSKEIADKERCPDSDVAVPMRDELCRNLQG